MCNCARHSAAVSATSSIRRGTSGRFSWPSSGPRAAGERGRARAGVLEEAHGGTLVLDDALALPADLRARLARASGSRTAPRVGATESIPVDARLVLIARTRALASSAQSTEDLLD